MYIDRLYVTIKERERRFASLVDHVEYKNNSTERFFKQPVKIITAGKQKSKNLENTNGKKNNYMITLIYKVRKLYMRWKWHGYKGGTYGEKLNLNLQKGQTRWQEQKLIDFIRLCTWKTKFLETSSEGLFRTPSDRISHRIHIVRTSCSQLATRSGIFCLLVEVVY